MSINAVQISFVLGIAGISIFAGAGDVDPPGAPEPTPGPEPRTPITAVPVTIEEPGSYYLIRNMVGVAGENGIVIAASDVTFDLMGFTLAGVAGSLTGIDVPSPEVNITVCNGTVQGWGEDGVDAGEADNSRLLDLCASDNGTGIMDHDGLRLGEGGVIARCVSRGHPAEGISADDGTTVVDCAASDNNIGISAAGTVSNCSARGNSFGGFSVGYAVVTNCTSSFNDGYGFRIDRGTVSECVALQNGGNGIWVNGDSLVTGNICTDHFSGAGIFAGSGPSTARIEGNDVSGNDIGIQVLASGNLIIRNTAHGNTTSNFSINSGNAYGPIVNVAGAGDISTIISGNNSHPWANFEY